MNISLGGVLVAYALLEHQPKGEDGHALQPRYQFVVEIFLFFRDFSLEVVLIEIRLVALDALHFALFEHPETDAVLAWLQRIQRIVYAHNFNA